MPGVHLHEHARICGAMTMVEGQETVFANSRLIAVEEDPNSHGGGMLISGTKAVYIANKLIINNTPDESGADALCPLPPHCAPSTDEGSEDVFCGDEA